MDNVFICVNRNAHVDGLNEISAIRTNGRLGHLTPKCVLAAFTSMVGDNLAEVFNQLKNKLNTSDERFVVITLNTELTRMVIKKHGLEVPFSNRIWVDIQQLTWPLLVNNQIQNRTIDSLGAHFKVEKRPNPDSADDCMTLAQVYGQLMQRYKTALIGEETLREFGGETLDGIRKIVGF